MKPVRGFLESDSLGPSWSCPLISQTWFCLPLLALLLVRPPAAPFPVFLSFLRAQEQGDLTCGCNGWGICSLLRLPTHARPNLSSGVLGESKTDDTLQKWPGDMMWNANLSPLLPHPIVTQRGQKFFDITFDLRSLTEGVWKRHLEMGDRPKKEILSNPPKSPLKRFCLPQKVLPSPHLGP